MWLQLYSINLMLIGIDSFDCGFEIDARKKKMIVIVRSILIFFNDHHMSGVI